MKKFIIGLSPAMIIFAIIVWPHVFKDTVSFAPQWRVGQEWKLQVFAKRTGDSSSYYHNIWEFKIKKKAETDGGVQYTIAAREAKKQSGLGYEFTVSYPNLVLKRITTYQDMKPVKTETPKSRAFFLDAAGPSLLPLAFSPLPVFKLKRSSRDKALTVRAARVFDGVTQMSQMRQAVVVRSVRRLDVVTAAKLVGGGQIEALQSWEEGKPWWSGARRIKDGVKESEAILIE